MSDTADIKMYLTRAEAAKVIRNAPDGSRFYLHVRMDLPLAENPDRAFIGGGSTSLKLSRTEAEKLAANAMSETLENRGGRIPLSKHVSDLDNKISYWLG